MKRFARLRRPDGSPSEFVRTASATVKLLDRRQERLLSYGEYKEFTLED